MYLDKVEFILENFKANIQGDIKNPQGNIDLGSTIVTLPSKDFVKVTGKVSVKGDKVNIDGINLDNNLITGQYNMQPFVKK